MTRWTARLTMPARETVSERTDERFLFRLYGGAWRARRVGPFAGRQWPTRIVQPPDRRPCRPRVRTEAIARWPASLRQILPGLANLRRLRVEDVAIPKAEIVAVPLDIGATNWSRCCRDSGFFAAAGLFRDAGPAGRAPAAQGSGAAQGARALGRGSFAGPLLRPLLFVPPSMPLIVLLQKMQTERTHMALVIDEYGGVDGLVTIEDICLNRSWAISTTSTTSRRRTTAIWKSRASGSSRRARRSRRSRPKPGST
jgi:hypothetical protein